jgi:hypothetical protein
MLIAHAGKRDKVGLFNTDLLYDILEDDKVIGHLVYDKKNLRGSLTLGNETYTIARATDRPEERLYQALARMLTGGEKPPPNPVVLRNGSGDALALAEHAKQGFAVCRGEDSLSLRKPSMMSRPFHLYRHGDERSLGSVGQQKFFSTTLHMNLPAEFEPSFQVFLLVLLLNLTMERLDNSVS